MRICPYCRLEHSPDDVSCKKCGSKLITDVGNVQDGVLLDNRYKIIELVGSGGMGAVYKACDIKLDGSTVAIKEMSTLGLSKETLEKAIESFKKEATLLINLRHSALPRVIDFFSEGHDKWFLVMDFIQGKTLDQVMQEEGKFSEEKVLEWAEQLCSVLKYLHNNNPPIIFRDLKPSNIMLTTEGTIKLIDFGIARYFDPYTSGDATWSFSPNFAPPELILKNEAGFYTDIYSLALVLHYLLTGIDPRKSETNVIVEPNTVVSVTDRLNSAIMKALSQQPDMRPQSIEEFNNLLFKNTNPRKLKKSLFLCITAFFCVTLFLTYKFGSPLYSKLFNVQSGSKEALTRSPLGSTQNVEYSHIDNKIYFSIPSDWQINDNNSNKYEKVENSNKVMELEIDYKADKSSPVETLIHDEFVGYNISKLKSRDNLNFYNCTRKEDLIYRNTLIVVVDNNSTFYLNLKSDLDNSKRLDEAVALIFQTLQFKKESYEEGIALKNDLPMQNDFKITPDIPIELSSKNEEFYNATPALAYKIAELLNESGKVPLNNDTSKTKEIITSKENKEYGQIIKIKGLPNIYMDESSDSFYFENEANIYITRKPLEKFFSFVTKEKNKSSYLYKWNDQIILQALEADLNHDNKKETIRLIYTGDIELSINDTNYKIIKDYWHTPNYEKQEIEMKLLTQNDKSITNVIVSISEFTNKIGSTEMLYIYYYEPGSINEIWNTNKATTPDINTTILRETVNVNVPQFAYSKNLPKECYNKLIAKLPSINEESLKYAYYLGTHISSDIKDINNDGVEELETTRAFGGIYDYFTGECKTYYKIEGLTVSPIAIDIEIFTE